jgi:predicted secreted Zn-dependent protease
MQGVYKHKPHSRETAEKIRQSYYRVVGKTAPDIDKILEDLENETPISTATKGANHYRRRY